MTQRLVQKVNGNVYSGLITPVPGSPDICVSHAVFRMTGSGGGGCQANLMRQRTMHELGFSGAICFARDDNEAQNRVLSSCGWDMGPQFYNLRSGHYITLWGTNFHMIDAEDQHK